MWPKSENKLDIMQYTQYNRSVTFVFGSEVSGNAKTTLLTYLLRTAKYVIIAGIVDGHAQVLLQYVIAGVLAAEVKRT